MNNERGGGAAVGARWASFVYVASSNQVEMLFMQLWCIINLYIGGVWPGLKARLLDL